MTESNYIVPPNALLESLKSGPYKTTAHAIAELVDNSWDADATQIGIALIVKGDKTKKPHAIAVLDDGSGMDADTLGHCLQWGFHGPGEERDGAGSPRHTRRSSGKGEKRLGKFGVGLVAASFGQCSDVHVLSWQNGETQSKGGEVPSLRIALRDDIRNELPTIEGAVLPEWATDGAFTGMPTAISEMQHGTLVVWREVETRNRSATVQEKVLELCGRIYRELIRFGKTRGRSFQIIVTIYDEDSRSSLASLPALPVDPTFLSNWNVPSLADYGFKDDITLFQPFTGHAGDSGKDASGQYLGALRSVPNPEHSSGTKHAGSYLLTASYRSERAMEDPLGERRDPGETRYGQLANRLRGVSILREGREIDLDRNWLRSDKTVDRWISVSIDFDNTLDALFGVSNDKQGARHLADLASVPITEIREQIKKLESDGTDDDADHLERLLVALDIRERLQRMQQEVADQRRNRRKNPKGPTTDPTHAPTDELVDVGGKMRKGGPALPMDDARPPDNLKEIEDVYGDDTKSGDQRAKETRPALVQKHDLKIDYVRDPSGSRLEMFSLKMGVSHMNVLFHEQHPLSEAMAKLLAPEDGDEPPTPHEVLRIVRGLIASYARILAEAERFDDHQYVALKQTLTLWGQKAARVFEDDSD